jgi:hypothetical protein
VGGVWACGAGARLGGVRRPPLRVGAQTGTATPRGRAIDRGSSGRGWLPRRRDDGRSPAGPRGQDAMVGELRPARGDTDAAREPRRHVNGTRGAPGSRPAPAWRGGCPRGVQWMSLGWKWVASSPDTSAVRVAYPASSHSPIRWCRMAHRLGDMRSCAGGDLLWSNFRLPAGLPQRDPVMMPAEKRWRPARSERGRQKASARSGDAGRRPEVTLSFREDTRARVPNRTKVL